jgi:acid phosphatase type 7
MKRLILFLVGIAAIVAGAPLFNAAERVVGGPFVAGATTTAARVVWIVEDDEVNLKTSAGSQVTSPSLRVKSTSLTGLQPNTRYEYSVGSGTEGGNGWFKTAPADAQPFRFFVYGDNRTRHDVHRQLIAQLLNHGIPDLVLQTGDMVENGNNTAQWPIFFDIEKELLRQTVFIPTLGNHERNTHYFQDIFHDGAPYYSFDWGNAHFAVIDSDIANVGRNERERSIFWNEQTRWLEEDLQANQKADFRFVMMHHPPFTAVASRQGDNAHVTALTPMFEKYRVAATFFGHDHNYQHYLKNGVHYVVTGGGGAPLYDVSRPPEGITKKAVRVENFVSVSVNGKIARFQAIAIDGSTIEEFQIESTAGKS